MREFCILIWHNQATGCELGWQLLAGSGAADVGQHRVLYHTREQMGPLHTPTCNTAGLQQWSHIPNFVCVFHRPESRILMLNQQKCSFVFILKIYCLPQGKVHKQENYQHEASSFTSQGFRFICKVRIILLISCFALFFIKVDSAENAQGSH